MAAGRFFRYELRTTDINAAEAFYTDAFGSGFWDSQVCVAPLPESAAARGAPAHWLGHIGVSDVEGTAARVAALGVQQLGRALLRDPFGAVIAVSSETAPLPKAPVAWHLHHSQDHERAFAWYAALFGWTATELVDLGPQAGCYQMFAWDESGRTVGGMANIARLPHIHPQWLFFFPVADVGDSRARVRAHGGIVLEPTQTPSGDIVAPCEDPQGAAFALYQFR
jgi:uncharacterized protein